MVKVVFEGKGKKDKVDDGGRCKLLPVEPEVYDKPSTSGVTAGLGVGRISPRVEQSRVVSPEPEMPPLEVPKPPVRADVESFKTDYMSVFGIDSIIPSNKDVLELNLLFAIYGELKRLNDKFNED
jgi:hypothetical protein